MSRKNSLKRLLSSALALLLCFTCFSFPTAADDDTGETAETSSANTAVTISYTSTVSYSDYYDTYEDAAHPRDEIPLTIVDWSEDADVTVGEFAGEDDVVIWANQEGQLNYTVNVETEGVYNIRVKYYPLVADDEAVADAGITVDGNTTTTEMTLYIDGELPYDTAERIEFPRIWKSNGEISVNSRGNETRPPQVQAPEWAETPLKDSDGLFNEPLEFYLTPGEHTISLYSENASVAIKSIELYCYESAEAYVAPTEEQLMENAGAATIKIQGENFTTANSQTLYPTYDRGTYNTENHNDELADPVKQQYNTVGDGTWSTSGQTITWTVNVEQDGYYKIGIKSRQGEMRGLYSNRRLYIDGEVPSEPFEQIKFYYSSDWQTVVPEDDTGETAYVYLTAGEHTLSLEAIPGEIGETMRRLDDVVYTANQYYMKILMITGPSPDEYTDYNVHKEIPELLDVFQELADQLYAEQAEIESLSDQGGSEATSLARLADVFEKCIDKPYKIPDYISSSSIKDNVSAVSSWMREYREQPLEIDFIEIAPAYDASGNDVEFTSSEESFLKALKFGWDAFIGSFFEDYTVLSDTTESSILVWCGLGRDQTNVVKDIVDSEFVSSYGADISINLVQGGIMEAVLAGKGPDVAIFIGGEYPVNLAIRGLLVPLDEMGGFDEVQTWFQENAMTHYTYDSHVYGIPLSQTFPMMFYRTDMLAEVGITEVPETWDDLIDILPALQRSYMQPGLILPANVNGTAVAPSTEVGHTFALLMLQSGMNYYNDDQTATNFDTIEASDAFDTWTKFYTTYGFDQTYDAFSRFRTGEMPIVIQNYSTFYNQLNVAAPEIKGLWDFTSVPSTEREDGTVSHAANSSGSGAMILSSCDNVEAAWEFIKWFSSADVMTEYGQNIEGVLGPIGRFEAANTEALQNLNWSKSDLAKINAQRDELEEIPITPSSYVVTREIMNAFRSVVNDYENARETLREYNEDINKEITRKRENLGLDVDDD
ncbi:MAG: extracellular solute-binding protein [Oscillospiraceae bacterium]|nr:extracellular solute-binding protein [Oscillospiraceae bacterium]